MVLGFSSALLVTAFALVLFAVAGAITWGLALLLTRLPVTAAKPRAAALEGTTAGGEIRLQVQPVTAPHSGLVLQVSILPGQPIHFAQELFTIDTGKQVLAVRSAREGIAGEVRVAEGEKVLGGQILMEFAEAEKSPQ